MSAHIWRHKRAFSIALLLLGALFVWIGPARTTPAANAQSSAEEPEPSAMALQPRVMPAPLPPTGGPYVEAESVRLSGLREAAARHAVEPRTESVRFMTYGEAIAWYQTGTSTEMDPYREVYVVSVPGRVTVGRHVQVSYTRSYYIYDAPTGRLVQWGATDNPDPVTEGRPLPR